MQLLLNDSILSEVKTKTEVLSKLYVELDKNLAIPITAGYQASDLVWIPFYAIGSRALADTNPEKSKDYADKAIAVMLHGCRTYMKGGWSAKLLSGRADGTTKSFPLRHKNIIPSSFKASFTPVSTKELTKSSANVDTTGLFYVIVSKVFDETQEYIKDVDWYVGNGAWNNQIGWTTTGKRPATGAKFTMEYGVHSTLQTATAYTLANDTVTFTVAPPAGKFIITHYVYHDVENDLRYQQDSERDGGVISAAIDTSYTTRNLGKNVALGLDWLWNHPGLKQPIKDEIASMLIQWFDYAKNFGYMKNGFESNYGCGHYVSMVFTAVALKDRHPEAQRLMNDVLSMRTQYLLPKLANANPSLKGGFWPEGWNYGKVAVQNILVAGKALEMCGVIDATPEHNYANEVISHLFGAAFTSTTIYDGGDWFAYPAPFPESNAFYSLYGMATDPELKKLCQFQINKGPRTTSWGELLYRDINAPAQDPWMANLPTDHFSEGTKLNFSRSDWTNKCISVTFQCGKIGGADHQSYTPGQVQIQRGSDILLCNAAVVVNDQYNHLKSTRGNTIIIDDNGEKAQVYRYSMGPWGQINGIFQKRFVKDKMLYCHGDYKLAYKTQLTNGPATKLTRELVYEKPGVVIVFDRVATTKDYYTKRLQWNFVKESVVVRDEVNNKFNVTRGDSKLFGQVFCTVPIKSTFQNVNMGNVNVYYQNLFYEMVNPVLGLNYITVFSVGDLTSTEPVVKVSNTEDNLFTCIEIDGTSYLFSNN